MKDEQAGVFTSEGSIRMTDSICMAIDNGRVIDITVTLLTDSKNVLVELWGARGVVVGQYLVDGPSAMRLLHLVGPNARRESIVTSRFDRCEGDCEHGNRDGVAEPGGEVSGYFSESQPGRKSWSLSSSVERSLLSRLSS